MSAGIKDITIEAGATFQIGLEWRQPASSDGTPGAAYDLTGCTADMEIRPKAGGEILVDLTEGNGITLGGVDGTIAIEIPWQTTQELTTKRAVYDLFITFPGNPGRREKVLKGKVTIDQPVTREVAP